MFFEIYNTRNSKGLWSTVSVNVGIPVELNGAFGVEIKFKGEIEGEHLIQNITKFTAIVTALNFVNCRLGDLESRGIKLFLPESKSEELPLFQTFGTFI